jgi:hypothetical protein
MDLRTNLARYLTGIKIYRLENLGIKDVLPST